MSSYVLTNLIVTGGMLTPGLQVGDSFTALGLESAKLTSHRADHRNPPLANRQPIAQRSHQQRKCQQINPSLDLANRPILPNGRLRLLLRSPGSEGPRAPPQEPLAKHQAHPRPSRPLRRRLQRQRPERLPHARRGNPPGYRRLPRPLGG